MSLDLLIHRETGQHIIHNQFIKITSEYTSITDNKQKWAKKSGHMFRPYKLFKQPWYPNLMSSFYKKHSLNPFFSSNFGKGDA